MISRRFALMLLALAPLGAADLTTEAWKADLDYLASELPKLHKNLFEKLTRKDFEAEVARLSEALPGMTDVEVRTALTRLVASAGNAHTRIDAFNRSAAFPIRFLQFGDDDYVVAARAEYSRAIGARLVSIGDIEVNEVRKRLLPLVPLETDLMAVTTLPGLLPSADVLRGSRILASGDPASFRFEKYGQQFWMTIAPQPGNQQGPLVTQPEGAHYETPLYLGDRQSYYWFRYLEDARALYIQYNSCQQMKSQSFADFTAKAMEAADRNGAMKVVIDLRHNGGGDSQVIDPLRAALKKRPALRAKGHLFVLTSPFTFSSGTMNAIQLQHEFKAQIVGEPSAQRLNTYGDIRSFRLPNSGLPVWYCTKYFRLSPDNRTYLMPDVKVELTAADFFEGKDPVLEWVLAQK